MGKFGPTAPDFGYDFPLYFPLYIVNVWVCWLLLSPYGGSNNQHTHYKVENTSFRRTFWKSLGQ